MTVSESRIIRITRPVLFAYDAKETVCSAVSRMRDLGGSGMIVLDSEATIVGIITERNVFELVGAELDPHVITVEEVMTREPLLIGSNVVPEEALQLMVEHNCEHLVVANHGEVLGIVLATDLIRQVAEDREALIRDLTHYITHG